MDLILWRHPEAEEGGEAIPDHKRRLTARGEKQAKKVAQWLHQHLPRRRRILVSPTERTQQAAHALELPYELEPKVGPGATVADLLAAAHWPEQGGAVLIIGHQPSLGRLAALLLSGDQAEWPVKKGALWWLSGRVREAQSQTVLRTVINPDFL
jgi:phosphohistidine phosphatase